MNVPMFSAFRRITSLVVLVGEFFLFGKVQPTANIAAVLLMVIGALRCW